jgi:hypothetical protein
MSLWSRLTLSGCDNTSRGGRCPLAANYLIMQRRSLVVPETNPTKTHEIFDSSYKVAGCHGRPSGFESRWNLSFWLGSSMSLNRFAIASLIVGVQGCVGLPSVPGSMRSRQPQG